MTTSMAQRTDAGSKLDSLCGGFTDPTHQSQTVFRKLLATLSEPGTIQQLAPMETPVPLSAAAYQVCLSMLDQETPLWLSPYFETHAGVANSLRFHCGCAIVDKPAAASFGLLYLSDEIDLTAFDSGSDAYPDRSATLILEVSSLEDSGNLVLTGPGISGNRRVAIEGLDEHWLNDLALNRQHFPCGVDLIFTCGSRVMALPRTTRIENESAEVTSCT